MENTVFNHKFTFGKIPFCCGRRENLVEITVHVRKRGGDPTFIIQNDEKIPSGFTPEYMELSICGNVWNRIHTDIIMGGQCLDSLIPYVRYMNDRKTFYTIFNLWKNFHLNGMNAGTKEQTAAVNAWLKETGERYDYTAACEYLKSIGMYEVPYTGKTVGREYHGEPYKYGHGWIVNDLPAEVLETLQKLTGENDKNRETA